MKHYLVWLAPFFFAVAVGNSKALADQAEKPSFPVEQTSAGRSKDAPSFAQVGTWPGFKRASLLGVVVTNGFAYLATAGLIIVDVTDPGRPQRVGSYAGNYASEVAVSGNYAYLAEGDEGLQVIDVSNPANPQRIGGYDTFGDTSGVTLRGNYAYLADASAGLQVIDVSNPATPFRVGHYYTGGFALGVAVSGNYAYLADGNAGLQVIDVSNPASPQRVGGYDSDGYASGITIKGNYAYLADGNEGLQVIDVSNPARPQRVGSYDSGGNASGITIRGNYAYLADGNEGLHVIDVSDPPNPQRVGGYNSSGVTHKVAVSENHAYLADDNSGLQVIDVGNPDNPQRVGGYNTGGIASGVAVSGNYAYLADGSAGLRVIEVSNPANSRQVGGYYTGGTPYRIAVNGNFAFVLDGVGLQVIDVSNPLTPQRVGGYATSGYASGVTVNGNYAYLADGDEGLQVIDVSNPALPQRVGGYNTSGYVSGVAVSGNLAYLADGYAGLQVIDVSNPATPQWVGGYNTFEYASGIAVRGNYAYLANGKGMSVIDVTTPTNPQWVGRYSTYRYVNSVAVSGDFAFLGEDSDYPFSMEDVGAVEAIDVSNPGDPLQVGGCNTSGSASGVTVNGNYAYLANGPWGLAIFSANLISSRPPQIIQYLLSRTISIGNATSFHLTAQGTPPLTYQWRKNGTNLSDGSRISGGTTASLTISNLQVSDAGAYTMVVTNAFGSVTSSVAELSVSFPGELVTLINYFPLPLYAHWVYAGTDWEGAPAITWNRVSSVSTNITLYTGRSPAFAYTTNVIHLTGAYKNPNTGVTYDTWVDYLASGGQFGIFGRDDLPDYSSRLDGGMFFPAQMTVGGSATNLSDAYHFGSFAGVETNVLELLERTSLHLTGGVGYFPDVLHIRRTSYYPSDTRVHDEWWARSVGKIKRQGISGRGAAHSFEMVVYDFFPIAPTILSKDGTMGFVSNAFGFNITGPAGQAVVIDGSSNLFNWLPLQTNTLGTGPFYFIDPSPANGPKRFFRVRNSP